MLFPGFGSADSYSIRNSVVLFIQNENKPAVQLYKFHNFLQSYTVKRLLTSRLGTVKSITFFYSV